ncbi:MAG: GNAT family N-acetyltransferase [Planctomycetota bacterium]|jgi:RimJ/RimL family protein N-acetyltransferase
MVSRKTDNKRSLIQRTLFRTVSRNLVRQLHDQGCSFRDLVDFANEILEEIILAGTVSKSMSPDHPSSRKGPRKKNATHDRTIADKLHADGKVNLTDEAYLRRIAESDIAAISQWRTDKAVAASLAARTLEAIVSDPAHAVSEDKAALFVICRQTDDKVIGLVGFPHVELETEQAECIKMIGEPSERGKGYARLAAKVLLDYGFNSLNLNRVYLYTLDGNLRNISLNQSLGFNFEGLLKQAVRVENKLRDVAIMALVKDQAGADKGHTSD